MAYQFKYKERSCGEKNKPTMATQIGFEPMGWMQANTMAFKAMPL